MNNTDRTNAIADANKIWLFDALTEIRDLAARFDTFGDPGRTRAFIGDIAQIASRALPKGN